MAVYHLSVKTISRSQGRSATAAAAYRAGVEISDERTGDVHDYRRKRGIESTTLILPAGAPAWAADRGALWNAAEQAETRKNSTVAREFEIALPAELPRLERQRLAHDFARELVDRHGCAADVSIHVPDRAGDQRNHHAHILLTTRRLTADGFTTKTRELDDRKSGEVERWRARFAALQNERLRGNQVSARVDHRSLDARGIDREPTGHLGPAAVGIERRTGQPSRKREDFEQAAAERQVREEERQGLEQEGRTVDRAIVALAVSLEAAQREQRRAAERPPVASLSIEDQAKVWDLAVERAADHRRDKAARVGSKARQRAERRDKALRELRAGQPRPPTGLLAIFKQRAYEDARKAWEGAYGRAEKLAKQAARLRERLSEAVEKARGWAYAKLRQAHPELVQRVEAHHRAQMRARFERQDQRERSWDKERDRGR